MSESGPRLSARQESILAWMIISIASLALVAVFGIWIATVIIGVRDFYRDIFAPHASAIFGVPASALVAVMLIVVFRQAYGAVELEAFGLKFRGAAGPVVLWVLCFLAIIAAIKILW